MSVILNALRRSERERGTVAAPNLEVHHGAVELPAGRPPLALLAGSAALLTAFLVAVFFLLMPPWDRADVPVAMLSDQSAAAASVDLEAADGKVLQRIEKPVTLASSAMRRDEETPPRKRVTELKLDQEPVVEPDPPVAQVVVTAEAIAPARAAPSKVTEPHPIPLAAKPVEPVRPSPPALETPAPAPQTARLPPDSRAAGMPAAEAAPEDVDEGLPMLWELPRDFSLSVPEIRMSLHIYDPQASSRFVRVNKRKYREGDWVADGLLLEEITPEGAVFAFDGTRFRVERP